MKIGVVGINHNTTPIEIREKFSFSESRRIEASNILQSNGIKEVVILSTCNRSEVYIMCEDIEDGISRVKNFYRDYFGYDDVEKYIFTRVQEECVKHLFLVSGGLDSIVIGEDQILNQIKDALEFSMELNFSKKVLNRLFMNALSVGKKIRSQIGISEIPLSTSYIGIKMLKEELGSFENKKALIIGAGEMSELALRYLYEGNLDKIYISNRSDGRLNEIFKEFPDTIAVDFKERYKYLSEVDILISATAAPHSIIYKEEIISIQNPLLILDLGLPRDIESSVQELPGVKLFSLDDLESVSENNAKKRESLAKEALSIIESDLNKFMVWLNTIKVDPYIGSLKEKCNEIKEDSLEYLFRRVELSSRDKKIMDKLIDYALERVVKEAILTMKDPDKAQNEVYQKVVKEIFDLEV